MELNIFETATRGRYRFPSDKGMLTVEDLWSLPLTSDTGKPNLNDIAKLINRDLKVNEESFVPSETATVNSEAVTKLDVVKRIIAVKVEERKAAADARTKAAKKEELMEALAEAEKGALKSNTPEELRAMLAAL